MRRAEPALRAGIRRTRWELRTLAGLSPALSRRFLKASGEFPTSETQIVIEGFPRTGNTFAVIAFQLAQARTVSIAHHVHVPASLIHAVRHDIPALVLLRNPEETVLSFVLRYPHVAMSQAIRGYVRFYRPLVPIRDHLVVGRFDEVTQDLGAVIRRINQRYGTAFAEFDATEENVRRAREVVDEWDRNTFGEGVDLERGRARPTEARSRMKDELRMVYRAPRLAPARRRAEEVYERMASR